MNPILSPILTYNIKPIIKHNIEPKIEHNIEPHIQPNIEPRVYKVHGDPNFFPTSEMWPELFPQFGLAP